MYKNTSVKMKKQIKSLNNLYFNRKKALSYHLWEKRKGYLNIKDIC